ncbi:hypothetical protein C1646_691695, partial [Rhizophagus diaphanus]
MIIFLFCLSSFSLLITSHYSIPLFSITSFHFALFLFLSCLLPIISFCLSSLLFVSHHLSSPSHYSSSSYFSFLFPITPLLFFTPFHLLLLLIIPLLFHFFI